MSREALEGSPWQGSGGEETYDFVSGATLNRLKGTGAWIHYKATLISPDTINTPGLQVVSLDYR